MKLVNVFCIYGYCLTIYVPVSIACVVPIDWLRWVLVMSATALSAGFLFMNFRATIYSAAPARCGEGGARVCS
ncbi:Protein YIPF1 [Tetrabaena socialis]|uniref:Protein YIPF1 n=1 Tax=Tetrabaena socialis TaxID=47790 RepID=A0A2J7ZML5_9CHLO|nr:Protein YIPF1 [Tetrabaena socialis]|eukprot:PNH01512.1 Protein YIPF1 [Tetrabaena socialis]